MSKISEILLQKISEKNSQIEDWFAQKFSANPPLIYNSVDLRHAFFKIAPVDTNCFPAGFNNLSELSKNFAKKVADDFLNQNFPTAKKILITPENHTQNLRYLENVRNLAEIFADKREVVIGSLIENLHEKTVIDLENGHTITLHPLVQKAQSIATLDGFSPDVIVMNNDLTSGIPQILHNSTTPVIPSLQLGWHRRLKSHHFTIYNKLAADFCAEFELDSWLISALQKECHNIDFKEQLGLEPLAAAVDKLLEEIAEKYHQYGIEEKPYCYIKADSGTYGMAVWSVESGEDVLQINKKERNKMNMLKGAVQNTSVLIQEGVRTVDRINGEIAEPMIYLMNGQIVGNLFRVNNSRDDKTNLNSSGATFFDLTNLNEEQIHLGATKNDVTKIYSIMARLAALAAAVENVQILNLQ